MILEIFILAKKLPPLYRMTISFETKATVGRATAGAWFCSALARGALARERPSRLFLRGLWVSALYWFFFVV